METLVLYTPRHTRPPPFFILSLLSLYLPISISQSRYLWFFLALLSLILISTQFYLYPLDLSPVYTCSRFLFSRSINSMSIVVFNFYSKILGHKENFHELFTFLVKISIFIHTFLKPGSVKKC